MPREQFDKLVQIMAKYVDGMFLALFIFSFLYILVPPTLQHFQPSESKIIRNNSGTLLLEKFGNHTRYLVNFDHRWARIQEHLQSNDNTCDISKHSLGSTRRHLSQHMAHVNKAINAVRT